MTLSYLDPLQSIAWLLALAVLLLALYILSYSSIGRSYRYVSLPFLALAFNSFGIGLFVAAPGLVQATWASYISAITSFILHPVLFLAAVALFKPDWLLWRWRQVRWGIWAFLLLPVLLIVLDVNTGTWLWYTGIDRQAFTGDFVPKQVYLGGQIAPVIEAVSSYLFPAVLIAFLLAVALRMEPKVPGRRLPWYLLGGYGVGLAIQLGLVLRLGEAVPALASSTILALSFAFVALRRITLERTAHVGGMQRRLTLLILAIAIPTLIGITVLLSGLAGAQLSRQADEQLQVTNQAVEANTSLWLRFNREALNHLVSLPDIKSMDPERQKPILRLTSTAYPHLYLVHTTNLNGFNVARNDNEAATAYDDRLWYRQAAAGEPVVLQTLIGRTAGEPALVLAAPIRDEAGEIVGVGSIVTELDDLSRSVEVSHIGSGGFAYIIDDANRVIAQPSPTFWPEFDELTDYPPVVALRQGARGFVSFTDEQGQRWRAYVDIVDNNWGIITQQPEAQLLSSILQFQWISWTVLVIASAVLLGLIWLTVRQVFRPVDVLTETAVAITAGDLSRVASVESEDELGLLGRAFNSMTGQMRSLINDLEERVAVRTRRLELVAAFGERLSGILDLDELLEVAVKQIKQNFNYYHIQVYLFDEPGEKLELTAGTANIDGVLKAGERSIPLNVEGNPIVRAANMAKVVMIDNVHEAEAIFPYPLLPDTRAQMAVPIMLEDQVIGVLDVQESNAVALDESDAGLLRSAANQIAAAINNSRLFKEAEAALAEVEALNRQLTREAWRDIHHKVDTTGYVFTRSGVSPAPRGWLPAMTEAIQQKSLALSQDEDDSGASAPLHSLAIPLTLRGEVIGVIGIERTPSANNGHGTLLTWSEDELVMVQTVAEQVALALDTARLARETERAAWRDRVVSETTAQVWASSEIEEVLKTAVAQLGDKLRASEVVIRLDADAVAKPDGFDLVPSKQSHDEF